MEKLKASVVVCTRAVSPSQLCLPLFGQAQSIEVYTSATVAVAYVYLYIPDFKITLARDTAALLCLSLSLSLLSFSLALLLCCMWNCRGCKYKRVACVRLERKWGVTLGMCMSTLVCGQKSIWETTKFGKKAGRCRDVTKNWKSFLQ